MEQFRGGARRGNLRAAEADIGRYRGQEVSLQWLFGPQLENLLRGLGRDTIANWRRHKRMLRQHGARRGHARLQSAVLSDCSASFSPEEQDAILKNFEK